MTEQINENPDPTAGAEPKKAPAKKAPAKKAAAKAEPEPTKDARNLYLPALPEGFEYTNITATGPNGATISITPAAGKDANPGEATLSFEGAGLDRSSTYPSMAEAAKAGGKAAKGMDNVFKREAELARLREEAFDL